MTRIRYTKNGIFQTTGRFMVTPDLIVHGIINTKSNSFSILDHEKNIIFTGNSSSLQGCKNKIRNKLISLGVNIYSEVRGGQ